MHTSHHGITTFVHNGDLSGNVQIIAAGATGTVIVPAEDILAWVAHEYVAPRRHDAIDEADYTVLLGP